MACTEEGESSCSVESDDESDGALEGKWLGLCIGLFFFLIFLAWLCRTLSSPQRRLQLISKFHHCCKVKHPESPTVIYPSSNHNGNSTPRRHSSASSTASDIESPTTKQDSKPVIYYKPSRPSRSNEGFPRAGTSVPTELDHFGHYHTENEEDASEGNGTPQNGYLTVPERPRPRHARGMRKSRSSVSMTSCNLAPIQEVDDREDSDAIQRVRERVVDASREGQINSSPLGSRSHPDRLASLAVYSDEDDDYTDKNDENERKTTESAPETGVRGVEGNTEQVTLDIASKYGNGDVNFVHGSDDEESIG
ncbi:hypothetical protein ElyMa_000429400 [Elysia marginata]|uniref:Uncharacterized protein n=1 Tax=Elysia marginata TaxID=1093978 RepID=A0AAV4FN10_9GAST|nr:hypothetical protein ElyMa_000429400 [Elysia marginata]